MATEWLLSVLVVYLCDCVADWELWLFVLLPNIVRVCVHRKKS